MTIDTPAQPDADCRALDTLVAAIPEGWSRADIAGEPWTVTRTTHVHGKVITLNAERLGGAEQLGANVWITSGGPILRPCEVPAEKVLQLLRSAAQAYSNPSRDQADPPWDRSKPSPN